MRRFVITFILALLCCATTALADTPEKQETPEPPETTIVEFTATTSETHLILFATLENSFTTEMIEILQSGIPLRFTFFVELYKTQENWPEEQITAYSFEHAIAFDTLREVYQVTLEEGNNKIQSFKSLVEAQELINEINGAKVVPLEQLIPDNLYKLKLKAELYQKTLPLSLHSILPFLSWGDIGTDWYTLEFTY